MAEKGTLIGVSVGPGEGGLLTLQAVETLRSCPVIAAPRTRTGETLAMNIARAGIERFLELADNGTDPETFWAEKTVLLLDFAMTNDPELFERTHRVAADRLEEALDKGQDVALLNLGDVSIYSSCHYVGAILEEEGYAVRYTAGVTSFCAAASLLGRSLTRMDTPVYIVPGAVGGEEVRRLLAEYGSKILMKTGSKLPETLAALHAEGLDACTSVVVNCGLPGEQVFPDLAAYEDALSRDREAVSSYFTLFLVTPPEETA